MMAFLTDILATTLATAFDVLPIVAILFVFQALVIRKKPPHLRRIVIGFVHVLLGLSLFLVGLEEALFPLGRTMAQQLTDPGFLGIGTGGDVRWRDYLWGYAFPAVGFSTTIAEPSLIAVAIKAQEVSGGTMKAFELRIAVAVGVAIGVSVGTFRIVTGTPIGLYIMVGYIVVIIQTFFATKTLIPLAYDSGGVTTSTVTVPVVAALGLGLATTIPGRSPLIDGFGLIAFASVFPIVSVLGYDMVSTWLRRLDRNDSKEDMQ